ncbi:MerR family transcriptional regulator [Marinimicrobium sp. ARAG 43.8]|uniref:MerR family transcriptional regulator n=1 Tax=Marinimicrobium sp. ARAG 43.8 TaxID=3418719 RepID=UPI003CEFE449
MSSSEERLPIRCVAERTGVNTVTLRAWERRYGLLKPERTSKGHRLYRPSDIDRVEAIQLWLKRGVSVGQIRALLEGEDAPQAMDDRWADVLNRLGQDIRALNRRALENWLMQATGEYPLEVLADHSLRPMLDQLRDERDRRQPTFGSAARLELFERVLTGHFASAFYRRPPSPRLPRVLLIDTGQSTDRVVSMILACALSVNTAEVDCFSSLPQAEWVYVVEQYSPSALVLLSDTPPAAGLEGQLRELTRQLDVPIWLAGRQVRLASADLAGRCLGERVGEVCGALSARLKSNSSSINGDGVERT